jgi:hypothetical protein
MNQFARRAESLPTANDVAGDLQLLIKAPSDETLHETRKGCRVPSEANLQASRLPIRNQAGLLFTGLLPCLFALAASIAGPRPAQSAAGTQRVPLAFHQYMVNLGEVPARRNHYARFAFTNRGTQPVEIRELRTSCGCLSEHLERRVFTPGETGELLLRIQAANQLPGSKEYACEVITGPPGDTSVVWSTDLVFRIVLPEHSVTLSPRALIVHQFNDKPTTNSVSIHDTRRRQLKAERVECDVPFVSASLLPRESLKPEDVDYGVVQQVEITVNAAPAGQHDLVVRVFTDDPEFDVIKVPVRVYGPNRSASPESAAAISDSPPETPPFAK